MPATVKSCASVDRSKYRLTWIAYLHSCTQVVAKAGDLQDDFKQTHSGSVFSANGLTVTMRIFAEAHECCTELIDAGWTICIASSEPTHAGSLLLSDKVAIVAAETFPSKAFLQVAAHEAPGKLVRIRVNISQIISMHRKARCVFTSHQALFPHPLRHVMRTCLSTSAGEHLKLLAHTLHCSSDSIGISFHQVCHFGVLYAAGQGKLPAAAALALTLHHCTANTDAQAATQEQSVRYCHYLAVALPAQSIVPVHGCGSTCTVRA